MLKIAHRVNDPAALRLLPHEFGVEVDIHAYGNRLVVHHDALCDGPDLSDWLNTYDHAFVILNIKEEGIEQSVLEMVTARGIDRFFMLDLSFPALIKMARRGERRVALRVSEYETVDSALTLAGQVEWVWIDVFQGFSITAAQHAALKAAGFKLCLVSPELHGRSPDEIDSFRDLMREQGLQMDAICTKRIDLW